MKDNYENVDNINVLSYDVDRLTNGGISMSSKDIVLVALHETKCTQEKGAAKIGWTKQQLNSRLARNSFKADDFLDLLDALGIEVTFSVKETGKVIRKQMCKGAGPRVRAMVDKVLYDTASSDVLANNFYADGINKFSDGKALELYMDKEGRYFFAEYSEWEGGKNRISPVSATDAAAFIEKYGTEIHKEPIAIIE